MSKTAAEKAGLAAYVGRKKAAGRRRKKSAKTDQQGFASHYATPRTPDIRGDRG